MSNTPLAELLDELAPLLADWPEPLEFDSEEIRVGDDAVIAFSDDNAPVYEMCTDPDCGCLEAYHARRAEWHRCIVAAVNALPRLIAIARAAQRALRQKEYEGHKFDQAGIDDGCWLCLLKAALANGGDET